jgi:hypothetical protein
LTRDRVSLQFAVHEAIADYYMSPMAVEFGRRHGDYFFYDLVTAAVALYELKSFYPEVQALIVSEDSLYATLNEQFLLYTKLHNDQVPEDDWIPQSDALTERFLQVQIEASKENEKKDLPPEG